MHMTHRHGPILALFVITLTACSLPQRAVKYSKVENNQITSFSTPSDLRLAFMRPAEANGVPIYCAEPIPDVALGSDVSASGSLSVSNAMSSAVSVNNALAKENEALRDQLNKAVDAYERDTHQQYKTSLSRSYGASAQAAASQSVNLAAAARLAVTVSELGGRSQQVLLAREFLYRLCEARANKFITDEKAYIALEATALEMIQNIYASQHTSTFAEDVTATADLVKQVNDYNGKQAALCDSQKKACDVVATADPDKKQCSSKFKECVDGIKPLAIPKLPEPQTTKPKSLIQGLRDAGTSLTGGGADGSSSQTAR